jgi:sulfoquinovosidase
MMKKYFSTILFILFLSSCTSKGKMILEKIEPVSQSLSEEISFSFKEAKFSIYHSKLNRSYIEFDLKEPFLQAASSIPDVKYKMASFSFDEKVQYRCIDQTVASIEKQENTVIIKGALKGNRCSTAYLMTFSPAENSSIQISVTLFDEKINRIYFTYLSNANEQFFGFGEQFSHFNLKGKKFPLFTEEQGIGRGDQPITIGANLTAGAGGNEFTSYAPIPHYITTENRSVFYENSSYSVFDLTDPQKVRVEFWEKDLMATVWLGNSPLELIEKYTSKTGRFPELPDWAYGTWMGLQGGTEKVTKHLDSAVAAGNPVTALWIQDWVGRRMTSFGSQLWWRWEADESSYPNFKEWVSRLKEKNIVTLGYINSFLANEGKMFDEAKTRGLLVKNRDGQDYQIATAGFPAYLIDQTNPATQKWLKEVIKKNLIDVGLAGWMADFGEWLPFDAKLHSGISAEVYHNQYPVEWSKLNREAIQEAGKEKEIVFFTRAGYSYSNKYTTLFWVGDQMVSFGVHDGLASTVVGLTSSGISGIALNHSDIGGYTTINNPLKNYHRSKDLFFRWTELNAFTPIFRTHEGNRPEKNHQPYTDEETIQFFARFGKIHYALRAYMKELVKEASQKGYPVVRHLYLHYPEDPNTFDLKHQFLLGEDILVLPVITQDAKEVYGYFPKGEWEHLFSDKVVTGGKFKKVPAPLGKPAVYVKKGGKWSDKIKESVKGL